jgi:flavin-dependent dehydrogenase
LRARVVVGADGANGLVARAAGLQKMRRLAAALEAEMDLPSASIEAWRGVWHLDFGAVPWGYGWIFPKAERLSVGIGTFRPDRHYNLRRFLDRFLASEPTLQSPRHVSLRGHLLPVGGRFEPVHAPRVLLVGDAAGLVDPFTGEGIYTAIKSGMMAAEAIACGLKSGEVSFAQYSPCIHAAFHRDYRYAWALNKVFYRVPRLAVHVMLQLPSFQKAAAQIIDGRAGYKHALWGVLKHPI